MKKPYDSLSLELQLLVLSIRVSLRGEEKERFKETLLVSWLNWNKVHSLLGYHQIIPVFYDACREVSFRNKYVDQYEAFSKRMAITNLIYEQEYLKIEEVLSVGNIKVVPYKGVLFLKELYKDKPLRQMSDLDILVHERDSVKALKLLLNEGYSFKEEVNTDAESLRRLIHDIPNKEISLKKVTAGGNTVWLDFHWHLNALKQEEIDIDKILQNTEETTWGNRSLEIPCSTSIFIMLLNHHAERDCWARLKYICDLWMYLKQFVISDLEKQAAEVKMSKVFTGGLQLINEHLGEKLRVSEAVPASTLKKIIQMWEIGKHWDQLLPKLRLLILYKNFQDEKMSWIDVFKEQIDFHSKKGLNNPKRVMDFPEKYTFLNAFSKLLGYIVSRVRA